MKLQQIQTQEQEPRSVGDRMVFEMMTRAGITKAKAKICHSVAIDFIKAICVDHGIIKEDDK